MKTPTPMLDDSPKVLRSEALEGAPERRPLARRSAVSAAPSAFADALVLSAGEPDPWGFGVLEAA